MSTNRFLRIVTVLGEARHPMNIVRLTVIINERFLKDYSPSLIGSDLKTLIADGRVKINDAKCFLLSEETVPA